MNAQAIFDSFKPGEHLAVLETPINVHRAAIALEDVGFEIRDQLIWLHDQDTGLFLQGSVSIILARKPIQGTVAENVLKYGTGAINVGACRIQHNDPDIERKKFDSPVGMEHCAREREGERGAGPAPEGRFPANVLHDGSPAVLKPFPDTLGAGGSTPIAKTTGFGRNIGTGDYEYDGSQRVVFNSGTGTAARFFKQVDSLVDLLETIHTLIHTGNGGRGEREKEN